MPASFSCQRSFPDSTSLGISAPGGAQHRFGADTASTNKKPGVERRACPSTLWGRCYSQTLPNGYARNSLFKIPAFVTNLTSSSVRRPGSSESYPRNPGFADIKGVYAVPCSSSSGLNVFFTFAPVNFSVSVETHSYVLLTKSPKPRLPSQYTPCRFNPTSAAACGPTGAPSDSVAAPNRAPRHRSSLCFLSRDRACAFQ